MQHHYGAGGAAKSTPIWRISSLHQFGDNGGMAIKNHIEALRKAKGWSRPRLAKEAGTSAQQIERLEKAQRRLSDVWLTRIGKALGVQPYELIAPVGTAGLPSEEELADMLRNAQQELPAGLPYSEWPRAVASGLRTRLGLLLNDRASVDGEGASPEPAPAEGAQPPAPTKPGAPA